MPRPPRCRRICDAPQVDTFCPQGHEEAAPILLTLDEYEVIRLVDLEQRTHQQCAAQMDISRSTVQEIYESARRKIAACLVYGRKLVITGGSYRICGGQEQARCTQCCRTKSEETHSNMQQHKGEANMKIAVTYANGQIFQHFGHTEQFKIYEIDGDRIVASEVVDTNGSGHGALAGFLMQHGVNTLICGGIGGGAQQALAQEHDSYLRLAAEYDNYRKRSQKEKESLYTDIRSETVEKFLPVYDNLERALAQETQDAAFKKGVEMTMNQLVSVMEKLGVVSFGAAGEVFDPQLHNAVMHVEDEALGENVIAEVFQKGFKVGEKVVRFATVKVAN